ncbi:unnamed protein product [Caenorhabditis bovis]|uniref:IPO4/5-like TPR repeats domain-containing protein n=1 Tax=Caenorhabditis bovis TaxID=2654633 RepID=A0A8S1F9E3_9PELO|nr:unnamed protein product [Caenorhabditis bovis]
MDIAAFTELLTHLQSSDNDVRKEAEAKYDTVEIPHKVAALYETYAQNPNNAEMRTTALIFLRRLVNKEGDELWKCFDADFKKGVLDKSLQMIVHESDLSIKKKIADLVSELGSSLIDDSGNQSWKELLEFMDHCFNSDDLGANYLGLLIVRGCPVIFGNNVDHFLPILKKAMLSAMAPQNDFQLRQCAVKAAVGFIVDNDDEKDVVKTFSGLVLDMLKVCVDTPESEDSDGPLGDLAELASSVSKCVTPHILQVIQVCLQIGSNKEKSEMARQNAVEVIISYMESAPKGFMKHALNTLGSIVELCVHLMSEIEDVELDQWLADDEEDDDYDDLPVVGESGIDRVACCINSKVLLPVFLPVAEKFLTAGNWKMKHAALRAFSAVGEGCQRAMEPHIDQFMAHITKFVNDEHPRVRFAACNAIGQMSTDFAPTLQKKCHSTVIPALLQCIDNYEVARVCSHAASALINFCEECPKSVIAQYIDLLVEKLQAALSNLFCRLNEKPYRLIVENVITALASVAESAEDLFKRYFETLVPKLVQVLMVVEEWKELRGKTIECISLIGYAVGKDVFRDTAIDILKMLGGSMADLAIDDPQYSYMISSWTRFCAVLGSDFAPFLPVIMDPVLRAAEYRPDFNILSGETPEHDEGFEYHSIGDEHQLGIRTSGLEEKATSCEMLVAFAKEMKGAFLPWVPKVSELALKNLDFALHDGVRQASADVMSNLIVCVEGQGVEAKRQLWVEFLNALHKSIMEDDDAEIIAAFLSALACCIDVMGGSAITPEEANVVVQILLKEMTNYGKRMQDRSEEDEDDDDAEGNDMDYITEIDAALLGSISELLHSLMKETRQLCYEALLPVFQCGIQLVQSQKHYFERQWGMCILDDAIEYSSEYVPSRFQITPLMLNCLNDEYPEVRQAAVYGFGVMALRTNEIKEYANDVMQSLEGIAAMIEDPQSRSTEESTVATENGVSAFAKIIMNVPLPPEAYNKCIEMFLSWLPTHADTDESPYIYTCLTELFNKQDQTLLGKDNCNVPRILLVSVCAIHNNAFQNDDKGNAARQNIETLIKNIYNAIPNIATTAGLDATLQGVLQTIVTQQ